MVGPRRTFHAREPMQVARSLDSSSQESSAILHVKLDRSQMASLRNRGGRLGTFWRDDQTPAFSSPPIDNLCDIHKLLLVIHRPIDLHSSAWQSH